MICTDEFADPSPVEMVAALSVDDVPVIDVVRIFACRPVAILIADQVVVVKLRVPLPWNECDVATLPSIGALTLRLET